MVVQANANLLILHSMLPGFGHGEPIARDASTRFRNKYGQNLEDVHRQLYAA